MLWQPMSESDKALYDDDDDDYDDYDDYDDDDDDDDYDDDDYDDDDDLFFSTHFNSHHFQITPQSSYACHQCLLTLALITEFNWGGFEV